VPHRTAEDDLVAHRGGTITGAFLHTLVLTDVATAWTDCFALRHRSPATVLFALDRARRLSPFPTAVDACQNAGRV
jgi:hypothetical protein